MAKSLRHPCAIWRLNPSDVAVWVAVAKINGSAWRPIRGVSVQRRAKASPRTVWRAVSRLVGAGLLTKRWATGKEPLPTYKVIRADRG